MPVTTGGIAYDRAGPRSGPTLVLLHAGVCDRRMWDDQWPDLTGTRDVLRPDLRGFGESSTRPAGQLDHAADVVDLLVTEGVEKCHLVGASMGAGVAVEVALARPDLVDGLLLAGPGGSLHPEMTPQFREFLDAEDAALGQGDLDAAAEVDVRTWVDGPGQPPDRVDASIRDRVRQMQRRAFELTADWDDVEEAEPDPEPLDRLGEITVPTTVLLGGLDLDVARLAADRVVAGVAGAARVDWPDVAHLPSLERPVPFTELVLARLR